MCEDCCLQAQHSPAAVMKAQLKRRSRRRSSFMFLCWRTQYEFRSMSSLQGGGSGNSMVRAFLLCSQPFCQHAEPQPSPGSWLKPLRFISTYCIGAWSNKLNVLQASRYSKSRRRIWPSADSLVAPSLCTVPTVDWQGYSSHIGSIVAGKVHIAFGYVLCRTPFVTPRRESGDGCPHF